MNEIKGFPPIAADDSRILVLGSMPSETSLKMQQYYGHRRNAFWHIMGELFGAGQEMDYEQRKQVLMQNGVAVWDVLNTCCRKGSMDSDINMESIQINDFNRFYSLHPLIEKVFFNGGTAEKVYTKQILPALAKQFDYLSYLRLPSTSPAYASMKLACKIEAWHVIRSELMACGKVSSLSTV